MVWVIILAVVAVVLLGLAVARRFMIRAAERRHPPTGQFVAVDGVRLHYVQKGDGRPVVLLHGNNGFILDWTMSVFDHLAERYRVVAFDRPGYGYSDPVTGSAALVPQIELLRGALAQLGIDRPILVGHSYSGALVLAFAILYPDEVSAVVHIAGVAFGGGPAPRTALALQQLTAYAYAAFFPLLGSLARRFLMQTLVPAFAPEPVPADYFDAAGALWTRPRQFRISMKEGLLLGEAVDRFSSRWGEIQVPVVILASDGDRHVNAHQHARRLHQAVSGSEMTILPDVGHDIQHVRPDVAIVAIETAVAAADGPQLRT